MELTDAKISSNFNLHLIKVGKLKRFQKVSSVSKTNKTDLANLRFLSFEKSMSINLNYVAWENRLNKKIVVCESFFFLKNLKFTCLEIFLSLFRL